MGLPHHPLCPVRAQPARRRLTPTAARVTQGTIIRDELCQLLRDHAVRPTQFRHRLIAQRAGAVLDYLQPARGEPRSPVAVAWLMISALVLAAAAAGFALARWTA